MQCFLLGTFALIDSVLNSVLIHYYLLFYLFIYFYFILLIIILQTIQFSTLSKSNAFYNEQKEHL